MVLGPPWLRTSALGDSTRRYSALSLKRSPLSKETVSRSRSGLRRTSLGQELVKDLAEGIALFSRQLAGFAGQHHRHAIADGIGQARGAADQLLPLAVIAQHALGQGTDQDFQQLGIGFHLALSLCPRGPRRASVDRAGAGLAAHFQKRQQGGGTLFEAPGFQQGLLLDG